MVKPSFLFRGKRCIPVESLKRVDATIAVSEEALLGHRRVLRDLIERELARKIAKALIDFLPVDEDARFLNKSFSVSFLYVDYKTAKETMFTLED